LINVTFAGTKVQKRSLLFPRRRKKKNKKRKRKGGEVRAAIVRYSDNPRYRERDTPFRDKTKKKKKKERGFTWGEGEKGVFKKPDPFFMASKKKESKSNTSA